MKGAACVVALDAEAVCLEGVEAGSLNTQLCSSSLCEREWVVGCKSGSSNGKEWEGVLYLEALVYFVDVVVVAAAAAAVVVVVVVVLVVVLVVVVLVVVVLVVVVVVLLVVVVVLVVVAKEAIAGTTGFAVALQWCPVCVREGRKGDNV